jgi:hypothetical protein
MSSDLFIVPTIGFDLLYAFVIVRLDHRDLVWINVTTHPTAEWIARQITEAFPWDGAPGYMIRDRDRIYGAVVTRRLRAMGIRDKPIAPASPWQNGFVERLIGSIRRECVDYIIILGEAHLRRILKSYTRYYNETRTYYRRIFTHRPSTATRVLNNRGSGPQTRIAAAPWRLQSVASRKRTRCLQTAMSQLADFEQAVELAYALSAHGKAADPSRCKP